METYINGKNTNTVEIKGNCVSCKKGKCDDFIKIEVIIPIHSDSTCMARFSYKVMKLNDCGNPNIDSLKTLKKLLDELT